VETRLHKLSSTHRNSKVLIMPKKKTQPEVLAKGLDLTASNKDYALFLPSISSIYVKMLSSNLMGKRTALPTGLTNGYEDLNFLGTKSELFRYQWALYSAGHAEWNLEKSNVSESMVQGRDRNRNVIVGDSGGFQFATGVLKWPWTPKKNQDQAAMLASRDQTRLDLLRWLEHTADWSMIFDFPPGGIDLYGYDEKTGIPLHPGLKSFGDCLQGSVENAEFFIKHRIPGKTKFLNVLQGRNQQEGDEWWDVCKDWPFESWAFANIQSHSTALNLRRLIIMRDGGYLENKDWLHYLGNGKIRAATTLTTIQRCLRKHVNPRVTLSYDAASPFVMVAKGQAYYTYVVNPQQMAFKGGPIPDRKEFKHSTQTFEDYAMQQLLTTGLVDTAGSTFDNLFELDQVARIKPVSSEISKKITIGDICIKGYEDVNAKELDPTVEALQQAMGLVEYAQFQDKNRKYPSSLDGLSYLLIMNHNVELHIRACQEACSWLDQPVSVARQHLPSEVLEFKDLCEEVFVSEKPMSLIEANWTLLSNSTGMDANNYKLSMSLDQITS
jgi:hypothetical protein